MYKHDFGYLPGTVLSKKKATTVPVRVGWPNIMDRTLSNVWFPSNRTIGGLRDDASAIFSHEQTQ